MEEWKKKRRSERNMGKKEEGKKGRREEGKYKKVKKTKLGIGRRKKEKN